MRTTIDLPDALGRQAKLAAVRRGISFKQLVTHALEHEIDPGASRSGRPDVSFPLIRSKNPGAYRITPKQIHEILVREEAAAYEATQRR